MMNRHPTHSASRSKRHSGKELRGGIERKRALWTAAQAGDVSRLIELGKLHLGQSDDGSPDADSLALELGRKLRADDA